MDIEQVSDIITKIADGFEDAVINCMQDNSEYFTNAVQEQLYSGLNGKCEHLSPTYDEDPYFNTVHWRHLYEGVSFEGATGYKEWKEKITPPEASTILNLPARPTSVPNLFIDGTFYDTISTDMMKDGVNVVAMGGDAPAIVAKYGSVILDITDVAIEHFNTNYTLSAIESFYANCGYQ
jgi:hypothetical protein